MSILLYRLQKRGKLLAKIAICILALIIPILLLLQRMDFVRLGIVPPVKIKWYNTLETRKEKIRRAEVWFKIWSYKNARWVYTDLLFGKTPESIKRYDWGAVPIRDMDKPKTDLLVYHLCVCLSELNQRREGMALCQQFEEHFLKSPYLKDVQDLNRQLMARQL